MTSLLGVEALLKAAKYLENLNDTDQLHNVLHENTTNKTFSIDEKRPNSQEPSIHRFVAIEEKNIEQTRNIVDVLPPCVISTVPTAYNINETLNLSTDSSGYITSNNISSTTNSSFINNADDSEIEKTFEEHKILNKPVSQNEASSTTTPTSLSHARRRTVSSNSSSLRSPSTVRAGTREVHNKLEKNRRAHLKECFEALKKQLPATPDEKKASNLSILGAAIRHIQSLKRKEREYEHEMERLAKEKIAAQNRILCLKRELQQWDIDYSKLFHEYVEVNGYEKTPDIEAANMVDANRISNTYSPSFRFGSDLNVINSSESSKGASIPTTTQRIVGISQLIPVKKPNEELLPLKSINVSSTVTPENCSIHPTLTYRQNQKPNAKLLSENSIQKVPLNLHANGSLSEMSNIPKNGVKVSNGYDIKSMTKTTTTVFNNSIPTNLSTSQQNSILSSSAKSEQIEPPTKLIKLIGNNAILAPIDNDNKIVHSGHITLQQVVGGNGQLVMSPIQLVASSQSLKVIGQPITNGLTTIELNPSMKGHQKSNAIRSQFTNQMPPGNLQKLLINNNGIATSSPGTLNIPTLNQHGLNGIKQITPGGAELNILPSSSVSTSGNGGIFQNQGKSLAIVKEINNVPNRLHVMQSQPNSVVSTSQNVNFVNSTSQISGKLILSNQSPMNPSVKSMYLLNNGNPCEKNSSVNSGEIIRNNL